MYKGKTKKFKDTIHGYIEIPDIIVSEIIDTALFQRLRYVEQTSMRPLYPAARHDRFIHSLGVYWLGKRAFTCFRNNAEKVLAEGENPPNEAWWDRQELLFNIGCLMHDCAHAAFSHTLEELYMLQKVTLEKDEAGCSKDNVLFRLDYELLKKCVNFDVDFKKDFLPNPEQAIVGKGVGAPHEKMSAFCVLSEYKKAIGRVAEKMTHDNSDGESKAKILLTDKDFVFIARMIIGCKFSDTESDYGSLKNCIIAMLNSTSIDVDGLDYIVRDAYMSGIDNFSIDYQRLLSSYTIFPVQTYENMEVKYNGAKLTGVWLKDGKFKFDMLKRGAKLKGKLLIEGSISEKDYSLFDENKQSGQINALQTQVFSQVSIENSIRDVSLLLKESCRLDGEFTGTIEKASRVISGVEENPLQGGRLEYRLGYEKNSLSIIQSTVEARNHEYLWVYTHPKVLYSSNYLQLQMLRDSAKFLCCKYHIKEVKFKESKLDFSQCEKCSYINKNRPKQITSEEDFILYILGFETFFTDKEDDKYSKLRKLGFHFFRTSDDDLNSLFKRIKLENCEEGTVKSDELEADFNEFFARKHRVALWKSFVEYDMFMRQYDVNKTLQELCKRAAARTSIYKNNFGTPSSEECKIFEKHGMKDVLIIRADVKTKQLNPNDTFIVFQNQALRLYEVFDRAILKEKLSKEFYYIFARMDKRMEKDDICALIGELERLESGT